MKTTYLATRIKKACQLYNLKPADIVKDPGLYETFKVMVTDVIKDLKDHQMVKCDMVKESIFPTDIGKIASAYYLDYKTALTFMSNCQERSAI